MSEPFPGMPPAPPPANPREAAAVILFRRHEGELELFWIKREKALRFAGGFYAFPGGKVDARDAEVEIRHALPESARLIAAAARELFEETGVLLARGAEGLPRETLQSLRRALLDKQVGFRELLGEHRLELHALDFHAAGRWITPPFLPSRFDAHFYLVELPGHAEAEVWPGELTEGAWVKPEEALSRWETGTALLHPPNLHALSVLSRFTRVEEALEKLWAPDFCPGFLAQLIEFQKGIRIFPMRTDTLPPATHTNAYLLGDEEMLIVDPGSADVREQARLLALVSGLQAQGRQPVAVVLTHHHQDHISGAQAIAERLRLPLWAHEETANKVPFAVSRHLHDGEVLSLAGAFPMDWRVMHTPGHARGHVCLVDEKTHAAVVGDMVAGVGTIVIDPPEGDMIDYLAQLKRLAAFPVGTLYPAHGAAIPDGPGKIAEYLQHRQERERKLLSSIADEGASLAEITRKAYDDVPEYVLPVAERNAEAILDKLAREGKATCEGALYRKR